MMDPVLGKRRTFPVIIKVGPERKLARDQLPGQARFVRRAIDALQGQRTSYHPPRGWGLAFTARTPLDQAPCRRHRAVQVMGTVTPLQRPCQPRPQLHTLLPLRASPPVARHPHYFTTPRERRTCVGFRMRLHFPLPPLSLRRMILRGGRAPSCERAWSAREQG